MIWLIYERSTGVVVSSLKGDDRPTVMNHHNVYKYNGATVPDYSSIKIVNGACVAVTDAIAIARARALRRVNRKRDVVQAGGCSTSKGVMQSDETSRVMLSGAVQMALIAQAQHQDFTMGWTMADNKTITLTAAEIIGAGLTMGSFISTSHAVSIGLKDRINAAKTVSEIEAIDIEGAAWRGPSVVTMQAQKGVTVATNVKL